MIGFTLEILSVFLLFKYILGYEFRKTRSLIAIGVLLVALDYALRIIYYENMPWCIVDFIALISATIAVYFFRGRVSVILGVGISLYSATALFYDLIYGIALITVQGNIDSINSIALNSITRIFCVITICVLSIQLKGKRKKIHLYVEKINPLIFIPFVVILYGLRLDSGYSGEIDQRTVIVIRGLNMTKDGVIGIFIVIICILAILLAIKKSELERMVYLNEKCIKEQTIQYEIIGKRDRELRKFRHDYNKHLVVLQDMASSRQYEEMASYICQLGEIRSKINFISTNNIICDAIVNQYYDKCREKNINLSVIGKMPSDIHMLETDLCVILSNGMENAFEAVLQCDGEKKIQLKIKSQGNFVLIEIINPTKDRVTINDGFIETIKADKENHGFGTKNMRETALRNGGSVTWEWDKRGSVTTRIVICGKST